MNNKDKKLINTFKFTERKYYLTYKNNTEILLFAILLEEI
jgi:hypothetical protein